MRNVIVALLSLTSTLAFADIPAHRDTHKDGDQNYRCVFKDREEDRACAAWVRLAEGDDEGDKELLGDDEGGNRGDAALVVRCRDGFSLRDYDARVKEDEGDLKVKGREGDNEARVTIFDALEECEKGGEHKLRARLSIDGDEGGSLFGKCRKVEDDEEEEDSQ